MNETQQSISTIIKGLGIYIIVSIAVTIFGVIDSLSSGVSMISAMATGDNPFSLGFIDILSILLDLGVIYGLYIYYTGLQKFAPSLDAVGSAACKNLSYGALLLMIAAGLDLIGVFVPIVGSVISGLCLIAAFILNIIGYSSLQKSGSLNALGIAGAKQLFMGFVFAIIAACCFWIPVIGWLGSPVLYILYWVYLFKGWGKIRASFAQ